MGFPNDPFGEFPKLKMANPPPSTAAYPSKMRTAKRLSNSAQTEAGQAALKTRPTGLSASLGRSGCFIRMGIIAPSALKVVAPYRRISSQKRLAEKRRERAIGKPMASARTVVRKSALAWNRGRQV